MSAIHCSECQVNNAEYEIHNGSEVNQYCLHCFREAVIDLITSNVQTIFTELLSNERNLKTYELG